MDVYVDALSPLFWVAVAGVALVVAIRTWPSETDAPRDRLSPENQLKMLERRQQFIFSMFEHFWGLWLCVSVFVFAIVFRLVWVWTTVGNS